MSLSRAPWTQDEADNLNEWQKMGLINQTLCGDRARHPEYKGLPVATRKGWICPSCGWKQEWAHDFMLARRPVLDDKASDENKFG